MSWGGGAPHPDSYADPERSKFLGYARRAGRALPSTNQPDPFARPPVVATPPNSSIPVWSSWQRHVTRLREIGILIALNEERLDCSANPNQEPLHPLLSFRRALRIPEM